MAGTDFMTNKLQSLADDSPFSLAQWQYALEQLNAWLAKKNLKASDNDKLEYMACTAKSINQPSLVDFGAEVLNMLDNFGFERAS
jgi:hypothetical protein